MIKQCKECKEFKLDSEIESERCHKCNAELARHYKRKYEELNTEYLKMLRDNLARNTDAIENCK